MKGIIKLSAVAFAVVALASCTEDITETGSVAQFSKNTLELNVEHMKGEVAHTRSAYTAAKNDRVWQETDVFTVFDDQLHKYDWYQYNKTSNKFELQPETTKDLDEPKFILFPTDWVENPQWIKLGNITKAEIAIPALFDYTEVDDSDPIAYVSDLPLWGTAEKDGDGIKGDVSFLTSILKISLTNALNNAAAVSVFAYEDIAGTTPKNITGNAEVILSEGGVVKSKEEAALKTPETGTNCITVLLDGSNMSTDQNVIYVPIIAGHYGQIKVKYYTQAQIDGYSGTYDAAYLDPTVGTIINVSSTAGKDYTYVDKDFKRATPYAGAKKEFTINANTVSKLNEALAVNTAAEFTVTDAATVVDEDLVIPGGSGNLTLNVPSFTTNGLSIVEADGEEFSGALTLNVTSATAGIAGNMTVNLPNATGVKINVKKAGNYALNIDAKNAAVCVVGEDWNGFTMTNAADLFIGDGEATTTVTTTKLKPVAEYAGNVTVEKEAVLTGDINLAENHKTEAITIDGEVTGSIIVATSQLAPTTTITVNGKSGAVLAQNNTNNANIIIAGEAANVVTKGTGDITISGKASKVQALSGNITISGYAANAITTTGNITISGDPAYNATGYAKLATAVTAGGNITVDLTGEGAAISTSATFTKPGTLTLKQGYVRNVIVNDPASTAAKPSVVTITNGNEGAYAMIGAATKTSGDIIISNASKWNGKAVGEGVPAPGTTDTYVQADVIADYKTYASNKYIATGTAFAEIVSDKNVTGTNTIVADINLDNKTFVPAKGIGTLRGVTAHKNGGIPTVSNITLKELAATTTTGYGLFKAANASSVTIQDLKFDGITITTATAGNVENVGALIGKAGSANLTISNVTLTGISISGAKGSNNIGGVIGQISSTAQATLTDVTATSSITGFKALGGLVGYVANGAKITFAKGGTTDAPTFCSATATFTQNLSGNDPEAHYAMVGDFIGYTDNTVSNAANVNIYVATIPAAAAYTVSNASVITPLTKWGVASGGGSYLKRDIVRGQYLVGFTGESTTDTYGVTFTDNLTTGTKSGAYINKGIVTAAPSATVKFLDYIKNF